MKENLEKYLVAIEKIGGDCRKLIFENPASELDIINIESVLNYKIPNDFRNILLTVSSRCEFKWFLPDNLSLPDPLKQIFCGQLHWDLDRFINFNESKDSWVNEVFSNVEDEYDKIWHNKFVFQEVGNGDYLSID